MPKTLKGLLLCVAILLIMSVSFAAPGVVRLLFFHSKGCDSCREIKTEVLPVLQEKYGRDLEVKSLEIGSISNFELLLKLEEQAGRKINKTPPLIFIGKDVLAGATAIRENLDLMIGKYQRQGGIGFPDAVLSEIPDSKPKATTEFEKISLVALIAGALLDGINPCAFTTLIFLISYLAFIGRKGKQLLLSGFLFSLGVFTAYFLAGIGVMEVLNQLQAMEFIGKALRWLVIVMAVLFGWLNLCDYVALKSGKIAGLKLGLGNHLKQKIHAVIRTEKHSAGYLSGLFLGVAVGLLELPCTGQVYFPIIMMVRETNSARTKAIGYLLLYNLIFILPLIAVFTGVYSGLFSANLTKLLRDHLPKVKLLTALFFFSLALSLILF